MGLVASDEAFLAVEHHVRGAGIRHQGNAVVRQAAIYLAVDPLLNEGRDIHHEEGIR